MVNATVRWKSGSMLAVDVTLVEHESLLINTNQALQFLVGGLVFSVAPSEMPRALRSTSLNANSFAGINASIDKNRIAAAAALAMKHIQSVLSTAVLTLPSSVNMVAMSGRLSLASATIDTAQTESAEANVGAATKDKVLNDLTNEASSIRREVATLNEELLSVGGDTQGLLPPATNDHSISNEGALKDLMAAAAADYSQLIAGHSRLKGDLSQADARLAELTQQSRASVKGALEIETLMRKLSDLQGQITSLEASAAALKSEIDGQELGSTSDAASMKSLAERLKTLQADLLNVKGSYSSDITATSTAEQHLDGPSPHQSLRTKCARSSIAVLKREIDELNVSSAQKQATITATETFIVVKFHTMLEKVNSSCAKQAQIMEIMLRSLAEGEARGRAAAQNEMVDGCGSSTFDLVASPMLAAPRPLLEDAAVVPTQNVTSQPPQLPSPFGEELLADYEKDLKALLRLSEFGVAGAHDDNYADPLLLEEATGQCREVVARNYVEDSDVLRAEHHRLVEPWRRRQSPDPSTGRPLPSSQRGPYSIAEVAEPLPVYLGHQYAAIQQAW